MFPANHRLKRNWSSESFQKQRYESEDDRGLATFEPITAGKNRLIVHDEVRETQETNGVYLCTVSGLLTTVHGVSSFVNTLPRFICSVPPVVPHQQTVRCIRYEFC